MMAKSKPKHTVLETSSQQKSLQGWIDHYLAKSRDLLEMDEMPLGLGFVHTPTRVYMIPAIAESREEKALIKKAIRRFINKGRVTAAFFVGQAWLRDLDDLDRILGDALVVEARDANEHWWVYQRYVKQLNGGVSFGEVDTFPLDEDENPNAWLAGCRFTA